MDFQSPKRLVNLHVGTVGENIDCDVALVTGSDMNGTGAGAGGLG